MRAAAPQVTTTYGTIRGSATDGCAVFRGIPFARPPFGADRFAAPRQPEPWDGVREATAYGPPPPQSERITVTTMEAYAGAADLLDCLTLNVWSPDLGAARLPVMVWIYGGAYLAGASAQPMYDGAPLAADGVVVVTFNYRVGMEGFGQIRGAPANRGLLDQVAALRWVRDNIAAFGGDPDNVTVFGESAGAGSIAALLAMPSAAGLFRRAIAQSIPGTFFSSALAADIASVIAARLDVPATVDAMAGTAPSALVEAVDDVAAEMIKYEDRWGPVAHTPTPFSPVVDGEVLPRSPFGEPAPSRDVDLIVGCTRDEYRLFVMMGAGGVRPGAITEEQAATALRVFAPGGAAAYRAAYPDADPNLLYELVYSDWLFRMPTFRLGDAHAAAGGRTFCYELCWAAPVMGGALGACHALDVPLIFGRFDVEPASLMFDGGSPEKTEEAARLSGEMRAAWTRFAREGDPGWPECRPPESLTRVFDAEPSVASAPESASRRIWATHDFGELGLR